MTSKKEFRKRRPSDAPAIGAQQNVAETELYGSGITLEGIQEILPDLLRRLGVKIICREVFEHGSNRHATLRLEDENYEPQSTTIDIPLYPKKMTHLEDPGEYRVCMGRKYYGLKLKDIPVRDMIDYVSWLEENAIRKGLPMSEEAQFLKVAIDRYRKSRKGSR